MTNASKLISLLKTKYALPLIAGFGLVLMVLIIKLQPSMEHQAEDKKPLAVNVINLASHNLRPSVIGFGSVEPDLTLEAKAEVKGRVVFIHPQLKKGATLAKDTLVLKIDDKDYQLSLRQAEADLLSIEANLKEMQLTVENTKLDIKLAMEKMKVRQKEFNRLEKLRKSGSISQSKLDAERQNLLQQKQEVQQLENTQTTLPSQLEVLKAKIAISKAKVQQSIRDLERTEIRVPFNARVQSVATGQDQYVALGASLFDISGVDKVIINAQFPTSQFRKITAGFDKQKLNFEQLVTNNQMSELFQSLGLRAEVTIAGGNFQSWQAKVERISDNIDPKSRTIGVMVSVSDSYKHIEPGVRPPLLEGNYMRVALSGATQEFMVLPRAAIHQQQIYRVDGNNRLQRVDVKTIQMQGELALINKSTQDVSSLNIGDKIITSDVFPAVNGMSVEAIIDEQSEAKLAKWLEAAK